MTIFQISKDDLARLLARAREECMSPEIIMRLEWFVDCRDHGSVSETCRKFGISRATFYRWATKFQPENLRSLENTFILPVTRRTLPTTLRIELPSTPSRPRRSLLFGALVFIAVLQIAATSFFAGKLSGRSARATVQSEFIVPEKVTDLSDCTVQRRDNKKFLNCTFRLQDE